VSVFLAGVNTDTEMSERKNSINFMADAETVIKLLECPVCLDIIHAPIFQCFHGHLICKKCTKGVKNCPICRDEMPTKPIRNLALEKMTENCEFDCRNTPQGCQAKLKQADFKEHSLDCPYETRDFCRSLGLSVQICDQQIRKTDITDHMITCHNLKGVTGNKAEVLQSLEAYTQSLMWVPVYFQVYDTVFFITGSYSHRDETAKWNCIVAGSSKAATAYQVQLVLHATSPKIRLTWEGPVLGMNRTPPEVQNASFVVTKQSLDSFCLQASPKKPEWKLQVTIRKLQQRKESLPAPLIPVSVPESYPSVGSLSVALNHISIPSGSNNGNNKSRSRIPQWSDLRWVPYP